MGCGCRGGGRKSAKKTIGPITARPATETAKLRAVERKVEVANITGMNKQQRDAERKRRIQQIIARRSGQ